MTKKVHTKLSSSNKKSQVGGFTSENRYSRNREEEIARLEAELSPKDDSEDNEKGGDPVSQDSQPVTNPPKEDEKPKEVDWEKRFKDQQSYSTKKMTELNDTISNLKTQIDELSKEKTKPPKTQEELEAWVAKYPEVSDMFMTLVMNQNENLRQEFQQELSEYQKEKQQLALEKAKTQLLRKQPDFDEITASEEFVEWFSKQPAVIQDTISKPSLDEDGVNAASRTIDLFKYEVLNKGKRPDPKEAAGKVKTSGSDEPVDRGDKPKFLESQVAKMTSAEFEKNQDAILKAQSEGRFVYDLTAGAR